MRFDASACHTYAHHHPRASAYWMNWNGMQWIHTRIKPIHKHTMKWNAKIIITKNENWRKKNENENININIIECRQPGLCTMYTGIEIYCTRLWQRWWAWWRRGRCISLLSLLGYEILFIQCESIKYEHNATHILTSKMRETIFHFYFFALHLQLLVLLPLLLFPAFPQFIEFPWICSQILPSETFLHRFC